MIATVSMNFKYIGGQGMEAPVSELQNALSNNYFANTELYDPSATTNEESKKLTGEDAENFISTSLYNIAAGQTPWPVNVDGNTGGNTTD